MRTEFFGIDQFLSNYFEFYPFFLLGLKCFWDIGVSATLQLIFSIMWTNVLGFSTFQATLKDGF